jgi:hypothetical protein
MVSLIFFCQSVVYVIINRWMFSILDSVFETIVYIQLLHSISPQKFDTHPNKP